MIRTSALLETPEWHVGIQRVAAVDPGSSGLEFVGSLQGTIDVLREDGCGQTVHSVVRLVDDILLVLELDDDTDGSEDLLLDNLHLRLGIGENCGLNGPDGRMSLSATQKGKCKHTSMKNPSFPTRPPPTWILAPSCLPDSMYDMIR